MKQSELFILLQDKFVSYWCFGHFHFRDVGRCTDRMYIRWLVIDQVSTSRRAPEVVASAKGRISARVWCPILVLWVGAIKLVLVSLQSPVQSIGSMYSRMEEIGARDFNPKLFYGYPAGQSTISSTSLQWMRLAKMQKFTIEVMCLYFLHSTILGDTGKKPALT